MSKNRIICTVINTFAIGLLAILKTLCYNPFDEKITLSFIDNLFSYSTQADKVAFSVMDKPSVVTFFLITVLLYTVGIGLSIADQQLKNDIRPAIADFLMIANALVFAGVVNYAKGSLLICIVWLIVDICFSVRTAKHRDDEEK